VTTSRFPILFSRRPAMSIFTVLILLILSLLLWLVFETILYAISH
jgi:hypothetical protein